MFKFSYILFLFYILGKLAVYTIPVGQGDGSVIKCPANLGGYLSIIDMGRHAGDVPAATVRHVLGIDALSRTGLLHGQNI